MGTGKAKINNDEAKYIFFWGMDMNFKKENQVSTENNESITEGVTE